jgi:uncharacterized membrane protein (UPF0127 family)
MSATLVNARSGQVLATAIAFAVTRASRRQGLLQRDGLAPSSGLLLKPCFAVHTAFMRFAIDVIFIDRAGAVTRVVRRLQPWRIAGSWRAHAIIELAAGALSTRDVIVGDRLLLSGDQPQVPGIGSAPDDRAPRRSEARP